MGSDTENEDWLIPPRFWRWAGTPAARLAVLWIVCIGCAAQRYDHARRTFDNPFGGFSRVDSGYREQVTLDPAGNLIVTRVPVGNAGHVQIDFGGQWLLGRMVVEGHTRDLYDRNVQWRVARAGFRRESEPPEVADGFPDHLQPATLRAKSPKHDADAIMGWVMGSDSPRWQEVGPAVAAPFAADNPLAVAVLAQSANNHLTPELVKDVTAKRVGGPLYPPVHGFVYAPLATFDPATAYAIFQVLSIVATFVAGLGASYLTRGKIAWPAATLLFLLFPGARSGLDLGQNQAFTLAVAVWGWALAVRGRDGLGGMVWGLFAIKPVWGLAFVVVPLVTGRWKFCLAMAATGCGLAALTLPVTGIQVWQDWLEVGKEATGTYKVNANWIQLSRDLHGLPRRLLTDFTIPEGSRVDHPWANPLGWGLWGFVLGTSAVVYVWRADPRNRTGLGIGVLFLGAYLCCFRFMYYDVLLASVAVVVLFADPARAFRTWAFDFRPADPPAVPDPFGPRATGYVNSVALTLVALVLVGENWVYKFDPRATVAAPGFWYATEGRPAPQLVLGVNYWNAWDTTLLLVLWAWCVVRLAVCGESPDADAAGNSPSRPATGP